MSFFRPILQEISLTEQQWRIIRALYELGATEPMQLAERCCILSPSLTGILKRLEQQNYIHRRKSVGDQRRVLISLTDHAIAIYDEVSPRLEARYKLMESQFSQEKMTQLHQLLKQLSQLEP